MSTEKGYTKLACFNRKTGQLLGYLGTLRNYLTLVEDKENGAWVQWRPEDKLMYLAKSTTPADRFLGVAERGYAGWSLQGTSWVNAVDYQTDHSIAIKGDTKRRLYGPYETLGSQYVCWSEDDTNDNILRCEMVD
jgi:hypothetical protein